MGVIGKLGHPDESAFSVVVGLVQRRVVLHVPGHVSHTKWEHHRGTIEHDVWRYGATARQLCGYIGEGVGNAVHIILGRLRSQKRLGLVLQARVVEDAGSRNRRGVCPLTLEAQTLQSAIDIVAD